MGKLTELRIRNAKPKDRPYKIYDGDGLFLRVPPSDEKSWWLRYRLNGREQVYSLGKLRRVSLKEARDEAHRVLKLAAKGIQLTQHREAERERRIAEQATTFGAVAEQWAERSARVKGWSKDHKLKVRRSLGLADTPRGGCGDVLRRRLNDRPITEIDARLVHSVMVELERNRAAMAEKVRSRVRAVMNYAVWVGLIAGNPLPKAEGGEERAERRHFPAVTNLLGIGQILREASALTPQPSVGIQRAHILLSFTAQRIGEIAPARWDEFELDGVHVPVGDGHATKFDPNAGNWTIPRERMKQHRDRARGTHVVPLPPMLLSQLREWREADGEGALWVCVAKPGAKRPITPEAVDKHYREKLNLAGKHSPHSWRSAFSTVCRDAGKSGDVIESQLDHKVGSDRVASIYDRAKRIELRRDLLGWYERTLIAARDGAHVIPLARHQ
jgi:integrase